MQNAVLDYILTCTFAALIGELIGIGPGPGDITLLLLMPCVFGYFYFLLSFAGDYSRWLEETAVPLGVIYPRKSRARFEQSPGDLLTRGWDRNVRVPDGAL